MTQIFGGAPDLLDDFKKFLPECGTRQPCAAAAAKAAAAKAAAEDAANRLCAMSHPPSAVAGSASIPAIGTFSPPRPFATEKGKKRGSQVLPKRVAERFETVFGVGEPGNKVGTTTVLVMKYGHVGRACIC